VGLYDGRCLGQWNAWAEAGGRLDDVPLVLRAHVQRHLATTRRLARSTWK
jgi:hypothetical protein